jgi:predicted lipoprotein with Yx(FWY)xxD motif
MTSTAQLLDTTRRRLGGVAALVASAAILAACSSQAGGGATNPPAATTAAGGSSLTLAVSAIPTLGSFVTGKDGKSLYVFGKDTATTSACTTASDCQTTWPPLTVTSASDVTAGSGVTGAIGTITRTDGTMQVTLGGHPLYYYSGDSKAGDTTGQGLFNLWYLASPTGDPAGAAASTQAPAATGAPAATTCSGAYCY